MKLTLKKLAEIGNHTIHKKYVFPVLPTSTVLKRGNTRKIGSVVTKGKLRGFPIFYLVLEERATCPPECHHWDTCYGNGTAYAHRFQHGPELEAKLKEELSILNRKYPRGFLVRLHILGDFYSLDYVAKWGEFLRTFPALHTYGYTAHREDSPIGIGIQSLNIFNRCNIRFSNNSGRLNTAASIPVPGSIQCPEQTKKTENCGTCSFCWETDKPVYFKTH